MSRPKREKGYSEFSDDRFQWRSNNSLSRSYDNFFPTSGIHFNGNYWLASSENRSLPYQYGSNLDSEARRLESMHRMSRRGYEQHTGYPINPGAHWAAGDGRSYIGQWLAPGMNAPYQANPGRQRVAPKNAGKTSRREKKGICVGSSRTIVALFLLLGLLCAVAAATAIALALNKDSETTTIQGSFALEENFVPALSATSSPEYAAARVYVTEWIEPNCDAAFSVTNCRVGTVTFSNGSTIVDFLLIVPFAGVDINVLVTALVENILNFAPGRYTVRPDSISLSSGAQESDPVTTTVSTSTTTSTTTTTTTPPTTVNAAQSSASSASPTDTSNSVNVPNPSATPVTDVTNMSVTPVTPADTSTSNVTNVISGASNTMPTVSVSASANSTVTVTPSAGSLTNTGTINNTATTANPSVSVVTIPNISSSLSTASAGSVTNTDMLNNTATTANHSVSAITSPTISSGTITNPNLTTSTPINSTDGFSTVALTDHNGTIPSTLSSTTGETLSSKTTSTVNTTSNDQSSLSTASTVPTTFNISSGVPNNPGITDSSYIPLNVTENSQNTPLVTSTMSSVSTSALINSSQPMESTVATTTNNVMTTSSVVITTSPPMTSVDSTTLEEMTTTRAPPRSDPSINGTWGVWTTWTSCGVTCGGSTINRTRICTDGPGQCAGTDIQGQVCGDFPCPPLDIYGAWSTWESWTTCSRTCGGGVKNRTRSCVKENPTTDLDCVGAMEQPKTCNTFDCFDCNTPCEDGYELNANCSYCVCKSPVLVNTTVVTPNGAPIPGVQMTLGGRPDVLLGISAADGILHISELCEDGNVTFSREDFKPRTYSLADLPNRVYLSFSAALRVESGPINKARLVGEDVQLCCAFSGNPEPDYIEWFKNDVLIQLDINSEGVLNSSLLLKNVNKTDEALYSCRASNEFTAIRTDTAVLTVKKSIDEFSSVFPGSRVVELPDGCIYDGSTYFDVGKCENKKCRGNGSEGVPETCGESLNKCSTIATGTFVQVPCIQYEFDLFVVKSCRCGDCIEPTIDIIVHVVEVANGTDVKSAELLYKSELLGFTDEYGRFYMNVSIGTERVAVTARSNGTAYATNTGVLDLPTNAEGIYQLVVTMPAREKTEIKPNVSSTIAVTTSKQNIMIANVRVDSNSLYTPDGQQYNGSIANVYVSVVSSDDDNVGDAPGDYASTDQEGSRRALLTAGMFRMEFEAEDGTELAPATLNVERGSGIANDPDLLFWRFDEDTGYWVQVSDPQNSKRKKRQANQGGVIDSVTYSRTWYNFDKVDSITCYSKVRGYEDENLRPNDQLTGVVVAVIVESTSGEKSLSTVRAVGDSDENGYCVAHLCKKQPSDELYTGYITARKNTVFMKPQDPLSANLNHLNYRTVDSTIQVDMDFTQDGGFGPLYDWTSNFKYSQTCINAPITDAHFSFYTPQRYRCTASFKTAELGNAALTETCEIQNYDLWHSVKQHRKRSFKACYARIIARDYSPVLRVNANSRYSINVTQIPAQADFTSFGDIYECVKESYACVEVKYPDVVGCSSSSASHVLEGAVIPPRVSLSVVDVVGNNRALNVSELNPRLVQFQTDDPSLVQITPTELSFTLTSQMAKTENIGIFCTEEGESTIEVARDRSLAECQGAASDVYLASFGGRNCSSLDVVFVVDGSGSVGAVDFELTKTFMIEVVTRLRSNDSSLRVGVVQFNEQAVVEITLAQGSDSSMVASLIQNIIYMGSRTYIDEGIRAARENVFTQNGDRVDFPNVLILITDGDDSQGNGRTQGEQAKADGIFVACVAVGSGVDTAALTDISTLGDFYQVNDYDEISTLVSTVVPC